MLPRVITETLVQSMHGFKEYFEVQGDLPPDLIEDAKAAVYVCLDICEKEDLIKEIPAVDVFVEYNTLAIKIGKELLILSGEMDTQNMVHA